MYFCIDFASYHVFCRYYSLFSEEEIFLVFYLGGLKAPVELKILHLCLKEIQYSVPVGELRTTFKY